MAGVCLSHVFVLLACTLSCVSTARVRVEPTAKTADVLNAAVAPENVAVTATGTDSLAVEWDDPNGDTTEYRLSCTCSAADCIPYESTTVDTTGTCDNLTPGTEYTVTVTAKVNNADSPPSTAEMEYTQAEAPVIDQVTNPTTTSLTVSWTDPNGDTTDYRLSCTCSAAGCQSYNQLTGNTDTQGTCTGLTPGTAYIVTVTAIVNGLESPPSQESSGYTVVAPPTDFSVSTESDISLKAEWTAPYGNCEKILITYHEERTPNTKVPLDAACDAGTLMLDGLAGNGKYTVTIQTIHPDSEGQDSVIDENTTKEQWTLPSQVSGLATSDPTPDKVTVSWGLGADNVAGNELEFYVLTVHDISESDKCVQLITFSQGGDKEGPTDECPDGMKTKESMPDQTSVSYTVEDLQPCSQYRFSVFAQNTAGKGEDGETDDSSDVGEPADKTVITSTTPTTDAVTLTWELPTKPGRCNFVRSVINYTYKNCYTGDLMEITKNVTGDATSDTVEGLQPGWEYTFTVTTFTEAGPGLSKSDERKETTLGTEPSGPPTDVEVTTDNVTHNVIPLSWNPPVECERNGIITKYNVSWTYRDPQYPDSEGRAGSGSHESKSESYTIPAMPYKDYTISVAAITAHGTGPAETLATLQTLEWYAGQVDSSTVILDPSAPYSMKVSWQAPFEPQGNITNYTVMLRNEAGGPCETYNSLQCVGDKTVIVGREAAFTDLQPEFSWEFTGLQPYQNFIVTITATTKIGDGNPSDPKTAKTAIVAPYKPTDVALVKDGATKLTVKWTKPQYYPGPTNYSVYVKDTAPVDPQDKEVVVQGYESTEAEVEGLTPYWDYDVTVTAETSVGTNQSDVTPVKMPAAPPKAVENFGVEKDVMMCLGVEVDIVWTPLKTRDHHGTLSNYTVLFWKKGEEGNVKEKAFEAEEGDEQRRETLTSADGLESESNFEFKMVAYNTEYKGDESQQDEAYFGACPPRTPDGEALGSTSSSVTALPRGDNPLGKTDRRKMVRVAIKRSFFDDNSHGAQTKRGVYVMDTETAEGTTEIVGQEDLLAKNWWDVEKESPMKPYRIDLPLPYERQHRAKRYNEDDYELTIGADSECNEDFTCNGPLKEGREYKVRVFVCTAAGCTLTAPSSQIYATDKDNTSAIVGGVIGGLIGIALVALISNLVFLSRRGTSSANTKDDQKDSDDDIGLDPVSTQEAPYTTLNPGQEAAYTTLNPGQEGPYTTLNPGQEGPYSSLNPGQEGPYTTLNPGKEGPYTTLNPGKETPYTTLNPGQEGPYTTLNPGKETPYTTLNPGQEAPYTTLNPGQEAPYTTLDQPDPHVYYNTVIRSALPSADTSVEPANEHVYYNEA